jgi:hypothetical protein
MTINALQMVNLRARGRTGGDCVVLALTFITKASYLDVEELICQHHSRYMVPGGTRAYGVQTDKVFKNEFTIFGYRLSKIDVFPCSIHTFIQTHPEGTYFVRIHRHAFVVKDGQQFDACDSKHNNLVLGVWKVEKV